MQLFTHLALSYSVCDALSAMLACSTPLGGELQQLDQLWHVLAGEMGNTSFQCTLYLKNTLT